MLYVEDLEIIIFTLEFISSAFTPSISDIEERFPSDSSYDPIFNHIYFLLRDHADHGLTLADWLNNSDERISRTAEARKIFIIESVFSFYRNELTPFDITTMRNLILANFSSLSIGKFFNKNYHTKVTTKHGQVYLAPGEFRD